MEKEIYLKKRVASIRVEPYLAEYARRKFDVDPKTGGIRIPYTFDLYHCVYNQMSKPPREAGEVAGANLRINLPDSRVMPVRKHPEYWNWLSIAAATEIESCLRNMFNYDFHTVMMTNENLGRPRQQREIVDDFISEYCLTEISSDALLKNFQRYRMRLSPRKKRKYQKVTRI